MTIFNVYIYREMRLVFSAIEADTHEAAAFIARDKLTSDADEIDDCEGETYSALVDVQGDEEYEHSRFIDFGPERERRAASKLLTALVSLAEQADEDCPAGNRSRHFIDALSEATDAIAEAKGATITSESNQAALKPYSVLLLYPDWLNDSGTETYYAFVEAADAIDAVAVAQRHAAAAQPSVIDQPTDFAPLLVTEGHHASQPLFNR